MSVQQIIPSIKKEYWENNKSTFWLPAMLALLMSIGLLVISTLMNDYQITRIVEGIEKSDLGTSPAFIEIPIKLMFSIFIVMSYTVQFFYFLHCLYDDRRDMSIQFWRSLPVSDASSVGIKLIFGALVLPAIYFLIATALIILLFAVASLVLSIGYDVNFWEQWLNFSFLQAITWLGWNTILVAIWLFPLYTWLMLVSAFAKKSPFLWAILPVVLLLFAERLIVNFLELNSGMLIEALTDYFANSANDQGTGGVYLVNNSPIQIQLSNFSPNLASKLSVTATLLGCVFMYLTYWLRVNRSQE